MNLNRQLNSLYLFEIFLTCKILTKFVELQYYQEVQLLRDGFLQHRE